MVSLSTTCTSASEMAFCTTADIPSCPCSTNRPDSSRSGLTTRSPPTSSWVRSQVVADTASRIYVECLRFVRC
eukprot:3278529-Amphidinium_carterae.1